MNPLISKYISDIVVNKRDDYSYIQTYTIVDSCYSFFGINLLSYSNSSSFPFPSYSDSSYLNLDPFSDYRTCSLLGPIPYNLLSDYIEHISLLYNAWSTPLDKLLTLPISINSHCFNSDLFNPLHEIESGSSSIQNIDAIGQRMIKALYKVKEDSDNLQNNYYSFEDIFYISTRVNSIYHDFCRDQYKEFLVSNGELSNRDDSVDDLLSVNYYLDIPNLPILVKGLIDITL